MLNRQTAISIGDKNCPLSLVMAGAEDNNLRTFTSNKIKITGRPDFEKIDIFLASKLYHKW